MPVESPFFCGFRNLPVEGVGKGLQLALAPARSAGRLGGEAEGAKLNRPIAEGPPLPGVSRAEDFAAIVEDAKALVGKALGEGKVPRGGEVARDRIEHGLDAYRSASGTTIASTPGPASSGGMRAATKTARNRAGLPSRGRGGLEIGAAAEEPLRSSA